MDLGHIFSNMMSVTFLFALLNIIFINIILSGDNAVVIAMAVRSLPDKQRQQGIIWGTAGAVILRIGLTFVAAKLLEVPFVKLAGGVLILWIAVKLLLGDSDEGHEKQVNGLLQAIGTILMADLVMSLDNVLGVAGASNGNMALLLIGLATSIPIVVFASKLITKLMDRFPIIIVIGAMILGRVAGEMIISDPYMTKMFHHPGHMVAYAVQAALAVAVVGGAKLSTRYRAPQAVPAPIAQAAGNPFAVEGWDIL